VIKKSTTLILGAGASIPFGYPSGFQLLRAATSAAMVEALVRHDCPLEDAQRFRDALARSGQMSVDAFLEHRSDLLHVGKLATALALIPSESDERLFNRDQPHWYDLLFAAMNAPWDEFRANRLTVLTFNYDRSLEYYLSQALMNKFGRSADETMNAVGRMNIVHLHGCLGTLEERPYDGAVTNPELVRRAAEGIRVIHEGSQVPAFDLAREAIQESERVYLVGFGYHPVNLKRLATRKWKSTLEVYGSAFGLTDSEMTAIRNEFVNRNILLSNTSWESVAFLRNSPALAS
jgi:hypothetical protein